MAAMSAFPRSSPRLFGLFALAMLMACEPRVRERPTQSLATSEKSHAAPDAAAHPKEPPTAPVATLFLPDPSADPRDMPPPRALSARPASSASSSASAVAPAARVCRVALIGDSLTDTKSAGGGLYVRYLEKRCPESQFVNFAKGGAMVNQMRRKLATGVLVGAGFTHLVVFGGVNDLYSDETAGRTPAKAAADLAAMYAAGRAQGLRVVGLTVAPWGGFTRYYNPRRGAATQELNRWIVAQPAAGTLDVVVDAFSLLSCGDPERLCPGYDRLHSDGLHFGQAGHEVLAAALYDAEFNRCR